MKKILIYGLSTLMLASSAMTFTGCIDETEPTSGATAEQVEQKTPTISSKYCAVRQHTCASLGQQAITGDGGTAQ